MKCLYKNTLTRKPKHTHTHTSTGCGGNGQGEPWPPRQSHTHTHTLAHTYTHTHTHIHTHTRHARKNHTHTRSQAVLAMGRKSPRPQQPHYEAEYKAGSDDGLREQDTSPSELSFNRGPPQVCVSVVWCVYVCVCVFVCVSCVFMCVTELGLPSCVYYVPLCVFARVVVWVRCCGVGISIVVLSFQIDKQVLFLGAVIGCRH
jgi:hypothetical protein